MRSVLNLFANGHVYVDCNCNPAERLKYHSDKTRYNLSHHLSSKDCEVMQFTGLTDKNGREVYEGDLVRGSGSLTDDVFHIKQALPLCRNAWSYIERVGWFDGAKYHSLGRHTQIDGSYDDLLSFSEETEVIGNIHENPEFLLKD